MNNPLKSSLVGLKPQNLPNNSAFAFVLASFLVWANQTLQIVDASLILRNSLVNPTNVHIFEVDSYIGQIYVLVKCTKCYCKC